MHAFKPRIVGGTDYETVTHPQADDVYREARRRLSATGYDDHRSKFLATGCEIPAPMRYVALQMEFVANTLAALNPIPSDFTSDRYWPACGDGTQHLRHGDTTGA